MQDNRAELRITHGILGDGELFLVFLLFFLDQIASTGIKGELDWIRQTTSFLEIAQDSSHG